VPDRDRTPSRGSLPLHCDLGHLRDYKGLTPGHGTLVLLTDGTLTPSIKNAGMLSAAMVVACGGTAWFRITQEEIDTQESNRIVPR